MSTFTDLSLNTIKNETRHLNNAFDKMHYIVKKIYNQNIELFKIIIDNELLNHNFKSFILLDKNFMDLFKDIDIFKYIKHSPIFETMNIENMEKEFRKNMLLNCCLRDTIANEITENIWNTITIIAPEFSKNNKKNIKKNIQRTENPNTIRTFITKKYGTITQFNIKKKNITITLIKTNDQTIPIEANILIECQICFTMVPYRESTCKVCKKAEICATCEHIIFEKYNRCAFCNS